MIGVVKGFEVKKNRDGKKNVLMLQVQMSGPDDIQSVEYMSHAGDNHIPPVGSFVTVLDAGKSWKIAIASNDQQDFDSSLGEGERILYSGDSYIKMLDNGNIEINGNADYAVAFSKLKTEFNKTNGAINDLINRLLAWVPVPNDGGAALKLALTVPTPITVTGAVIDNAKVPEVLLP